MYLHLLGRWFDINQENAKTFESETMFETLEDYDF